MEATQDIYNRSSREEAEILTLTLIAEAPHLQKNGDGQLNYIDRSHWQSILEDIKEVREHLNTSSSESSPDLAIHDLKAVVPGASFLFSEQIPANLIQILTSLPPRPRCDMLVSVYFNSRYMMLDKS